MADADNILNELIAKIARENQWKNHEVNIKAITSGGANYTSALYLVNITLPEKDLKLFAKVAIVGERMRGVMKATRLFYLEAFFYNGLSKTYDDLQRKHSLSGDELFEYPKFYGCNTRLYEETVVMENLVSRGYGTYNRFKSVDWNHAAGSIEALAKFHALSFGYQKYNPEEFEKICADIKFEWSDPDENVKAMWGNMVKSKIELIKKQEDQDRVKVFFENCGDNIFVKFRHPIKTKTITHGDYRPSNILYKKKGSKVHAIPVDYQTIHTGNPVSDLIYFEALGTDSAFRAEYHDRLVEHYYSELVKALQRLDVDPTEVYPREVFDEELKQTLPYAVVIAICVLPIVLVEAENAPRVDGDVELESFLVSDTDVFTERFNGIVEDCVRWGGI